MPSYDIDYVLPLRWDAGQHSDRAAELTDYLRWLSGRARVIVVDGSCQVVFDRHHQLWGGWITHVAPDPSSVLNGKVAGVHTGLRLARAEAVVIADDDVRYDAESLQRTVDLLDQADLVGPQNVFVPMPWHAAWDSARSLLNRALAADYPGTFAIRRRTFERMGGYDGDVLFENLELMRTVRAHGGRVLRPHDIYVARLPTTAACFGSQRVRQAFDDVAQPWRLATFLSVLPLIASGRAGRRAVGTALLGSVLLAEAGRRRAGGAAWFPRRTSLLAPAWIMERAICSWLAVGQWAMFGGVRYAGRRIGVAAHSNGRLRREAAARRALVPTKRLKPPLVRPVAEGFERRSATATQGNSLPITVDLDAVNGGDAKPATHDEGAVRIRRQRRFAPVTRLIGTLRVAPHAAVGAPPDR